MTAAVYDQLVGLLQPSGSGRHRTPSEQSDGLKRIRRLVLTEGIPEEVSLRVGGAEPRTRLLGLESVKADRRMVARPCDRGYGSSCLKSSVYSRKSTCDTSRWVRQASAQRVGTRQLSDSCARRNNESVLSAVKNDTFRTLATDTQFKGVVKEDMLIRLLEAFVWKNHG